ncbi:MAG: hypothetical protein H0U75_10680 [Legionella sp.]|nr:hypothetical protein [Legionella sp.]
MSLYSLAFAILLIAAIVLFSNEIKKTLKAIFEYKIAMILLPLILATYLIYSFDYWLLWALYYYLEFLEKCIDIIAVLIPFKSLSYLISAIIVLTLFAVLPVMVVNFIVNKRSYLPFQYPYLVSTVIWIVTAMVLVVR